MDTNGPGTSNDDGQIEGRTPGTEGEDGLVDDGTEPTVPGAPKRLSATPGDGSARLRWSPPYDDGGSPILYYEYQLARNNGSFGNWYDIPDSAAGRPNAGTFTVFALRNGDNYTFRVRAVNAVGPGPASNPARAALRDRTAPDDRESLDLIWLSRFGRTVADHFIDTLDGRVAPGAMAPAGSLPAGPALGLGPFVPGTFVVGQPPLVRSGQRG